VTLPANLLVLPGFGNCRQSRNWVLTLRLEAATFSQQFPNGVKCMPNCKRMAALAWLLLLASVAPFLVQPSWAQQEKPAPPALKVGDMAPDFDLQYFDGTGLKKVSLSQYRGKRSVVLAFFVFAFTAG
jgi:hypothetical protein